MQSSIMILLGELYALEMNDKMYMIQICFVAESPDGEYEMIHQYDEMEENSFKNLRYENAESEEIVEDFSSQTSSKKIKSSAVGRNIK
jgi:hypothetical protein